MSWLFDTNACIHLLKLHEPLTGRAKMVEPVAITVSTITLAELWYGAAKSRHPQRTRAEQDAFLAPFRVLPFDASAADHYANARAYLAAKGTPVGDRDLMIAAIALANRMTIVTSNTAEFTRIHGLNIEDWMVVGV